MAEIRVLFFANTHTGFNHIYFNPHYLQVWKFCIISSTGEYSFQDIGNMHNPARIILILRHSSLTLYTCL